MGLEMEYHVIPNITMEMINKNADKNHGVG